MINIVKLNPSQKAGMKALCSNKNICLMGEAGTGKTFLLNEYIAKCKADGKNVIITASTGIAAVNLGGVTMHSACAIPIPAYGHYEFDIKPSSIKALYTADVIIVEEVSMCRNDVFEYFHMVVRKIEKELKKKIQIIVCGDFFQLPPVVVKADINAFKRLGLDPSGYCFTTPAWKDFKFKNIILKDVVRQDDIEFIQELNKLRVGDTSCIPYFNKYVKTKEEIAELPTAMYICSTNVEAAQINDLELSKIEGPRCIYQAKREGYCGKDYSVDENLVLKKGAKVMFMVNDVVNNSYHNGETGIVTWLDDESVTVELKDGKHITVKPYRWATNKITVTNGMTSKKEVGAYYQLPLKLASATTMHKTQGQTYDSAVISPNSFADGQLYVAISRLRNIDGLTLTEPILPEYIKVNPLVLKFYNNEYEVPETRIQKKKDLIKKATTKHNEKTKKKKTTRKTTTTKKPATSKTKSTTASKTKTKTTAKKKTTAVKSTVKKPTTKKPVAKKATTTHKRTSAK